jgi:hypothetical protein
MPISVFAGDTSEVYYDGAAFVAAPQADAPAFTIRTLDYFEAQSVLALTDDAEKVRRCIALGLVAVDGSEDKAQAFVKKPRARLVNPLFAAIWETTWGN